MLKFKGSHATPQLARHQKSLTILALVVSTLTLGCSTQPTSLVPKATMGAYEDIYVLRSEREERTQNSTWCTEERAGFAPLNSKFLLDDRFAMWSTQVQAVDGRMIDSKATNMGDLRGCFGQTGDPKRVNFYAEGQIGSVSYVGSGDCLVVRADYPEKGITSVRCFLNLRGLPAGFTGGFLATNTVISKALLGGETDPPGYAQASIATIRLWKAH